MHEDDVDAFLLTHVDVDAFLFLHLFSFRLVLLAGIGLLMLVDLICLFN